MRNKLILLLALIFGLAAAFGVHGYLKNLEEAYRTSGNFTEVATAKQKITARTVVTNEMLEFKPMPVEYVLPGTVVASQDAVGKIARSDIYPGEPILTSRLARREDVAAGLAAKVVAGKRAISVPADNISALHGLVKVGDRVDVIVTFNTPDERKEAVTSTIVQNVPVLAINSDLESDDAAKQELATVSLMVDPIQAQQLALAIQQGSIHLALRAPDDGGSAPIRTIRLENLLR